MRKLESTFHLMVPKPPALSVQCSGSEILSHSQAHFFPRYLSIAAHNFSNDAEAVSFSVYKNNANARFCEAHGKSRKERSIAAKPRTYD
jgi:hypothetical protein